MNLFVYYKFLPSEFPCILKSVESLQRQLQEEFSLVTCGLLKRPHPDETGHHTWMETYTLDKLDVERIKSRLDQLAQEEKLPSPRRNEIFINV